MAQKPETSFSKLLHSKINREVYVEKMSNPFRSGQVDYYYESTGPILWAEHKWIEKPWTTDREPSKICPRKEWTNQRHWLERAHKNGKQAYAIIGIGKGRGTMCYVLDYPYAFSLEHSLFLTVKQTAEWIESKVL